VLVILAAVAYLVAFLPPKPLRDLWQGTTAYRATRDLVSIEGGGSGQVWTRYAQIAQEATGAGAVAVVSRHEDGHALLGSHGWTSTRKPPRWPSSMGSGRTTSPRTSTST